MANSRTRTTTRQTDPWAVYDALPPPIRAALQEGPQEWCPIWARTQLRKCAARRPMTEAITAIVVAINGGHAAEIKDAMPWNPRNAPKSKRTSPHLLAQATMQTSRRDAR